MAADTSNPTQRTLQELKAAIEAYDTDDRIDGEQIRAVASAARNLASALEDPVEQAQRFALQPLAQASLCAAWQCGLVAAWPARHMNSEALASFTGADRRLVGAGARHGIIRTKLMNWR